MTFELSTHIKSYITIHQAIQEMIKDLKKLKSTRTLLESEISEYLNEKSITILNVPKYRIYRYQNRLVLYHRNGKEAGVFT